MKYRLHIWEDPPNVRQVTSHTSDFQDRSGSRDWDSRWTGGRAPEPVTTFP